MKVLIIGNGAKELALMQHLMEKGGHEALVVPGNPGGHRFAQSIGTDLSALDADDILQTARNFQPDQILILDECFVRSPIPQALKEQGWNVFAPDKEAADVLYKKCRWTEYFDEFDLACPDHIIADSYDAAYTAIQESSAPWVLTRLQDPSEFAVCYLEEEAVDTLSAWFSEDPCHVMISDYIDAPRFYMSCLVNGDTVVPLQDAVIQRGIYEQEDDAETKGMGAYSPADTIDPSMAQKACDDLLVPFFSNLQKQGIPYRGWMAGEFLETGDDVICVNLKCGLSDCASILTFIRLQSDIMEAIQAVEHKEVPELNWSNKSAVSIVLAAKEYPNAPSKGVPIRIGEDFEGTFYPHRTRMEDDGHLVTNGGRVAIVAAEGNDRQEAAANALESASHIYCDDLFYRTDIGKEEE